MNVYRLKHSFTAGELSPLMDARIDFSRFKNGCVKLYNMVNLTQGPATRRPGTQFIYDLLSLGAAAESKTADVRIIPFEFNESDAYALVFFRHTDGTVRLVFGYGDGLVVYSATPPTECPPGTPVTPPYTPGDIVMLTIPGSWDLQKMDWAQSGDELYIAQSGDNPHIIKRHEHECWELISVTFTDQPTDWSVANGWPETVTFHQQRLVFGGNKTRPQTVWMSMAGDLSSFHVDTSALTDDMAVTFTLNSGQQNKIQWVKSGKVLYVGTLGDEWTVTGSTQPALTPKNILAQRQTNIGSEKTKPLSVNFTTLFVSLHGKSVKELVYDYAYDGYTANDMTILAPHLTEGYAIRDWAHQQVPHSIIWCVRWDGHLIGLTYQREHKVVGWHHHATNGDFLAVATISGVKREDSTVLVTGPGANREDEVWFLVGRQIDGDYKLYLEKYSRFFTGADSDIGYFLDSFAIYDGVPASTISGLDHLIGEEVYILADGTVHPPQTVSALGEITLNAEYSYVIVGLAYTSEIWPQLADIPTQQGVSFSRIQRVTKLNIDYYRSNGVYIGRWDSEDGEHEEERAFRTPKDPTGQAVPLFTGVASYDFPLGFDRKTLYFIRQKQPLPLTVVGVTDIVEVQE